MAAMHHCLALVLLSTCLALLLQPPRGARGAPLEPAYPGDDATPEQMAQYAAELRRYINMVTRPRCVCLLPGQAESGVGWGWTRTPAPLLSLRYGKRDRDDTPDFREWGPPHAAVPMGL